MPRSDYLFVINIICYPLNDCLVAPATCGAITNCLRILVALLLPHRCLAVASLSPRRCLAVASPSPCTPFCPPSSSSHPPLPPHEDSDGDGDSDCHQHRRLLSLPVPLPPPTPFFPPPSPCLDVSVMPDAPAAPPLPPSFVTDLTAVPLRLATVPRQRWHWQRRRRIAMDATVPTPMPPG